MPQSKGTWTMVYDQENNFSLTSIVDKEAKLVVITVGERLDFSAHQQFHEAYQKLPRGHEYKYIIDMAQTEFIDSAALGMLLLLRETAGGDQSRIEINNCNQLIKNILRVANFAKLFMVND